MTIKNIRRSEFSDLEGDIQFKLFECDIEIAIEEESNIEYAELCVTYLNNMNEELINNLCETSIKYCNEFLDDIGEETITFEKPTDVLKHITPLRMTIPEPENKTKPVICLELNCTWEVEHGLEWIVRDGKVMYVGPFHSIDPYGNCDAGKDWNYA